MTDSIFAPLITLYDKMDEAWHKTAVQYNFKCNGCEDNCCTSLFFHHTFIEQAYLRHGFSLLDKDKQKEVIHKAKTYCKKTFSKNSQIQSLKIMCPANENGQCLLYDYRPMICRLHGLPHEFNRPGFKSEISPGCDFGQFNDKPYIKFDRTPFYQQMARIEISFRQTKNTKGKTKKTVAQILTSQ